MKTLSTVVVVCFFLFLSTQTLYGQATGTDGSHPFSPDMSLSLNGYGAYVNVPASESLNITSQITVEAWINTNVSYTQQGIVEHYDWSSGGSGYVLRVNWQGKFEFVLIGSSTQYSAIQSTTTVMSGTWYHVAAVLDGNQQRIYVNGVLEASTNTYFGASGGTADLKIGTTLYNASQDAISFSGLIDEVRITAAARYGESFVPQRYLTSGGVFESPNVDETRGAWSFAQTADDNSGNSNHGILINGATFSSDNADAAAAQSNGITPLSEPEVSINFDNYNSGTQISTQYPDVNFYSNSPYFTTTCFQSPYTGYGASPSNLLCRGSAYYPTSTGFAELYVSFSKPVKNLRWNTCAVDNYGPMMFIDVYENYSSTPTRTNLYLNGYGRPLIPVYTDLTPFGDKITKIRVHSISDALGITFDDFKYTVVDTGKVDWVDFEAINSAIDNNPNAGGGKRIFPDKTSPNDTVNRRTVRVKAGTSLGSGKNVYFRSFDVDDPSTNYTQDDANQADANDNRGSDIWRGGELATNGISTTGSDNVATNILTVTKQPGDNFVIVASHDQAYLNGITIGVNGLRDSSGNTLSSDKAKVSPMLTVWRNLHVEVDSMGLSQGNFEGGVTYGSNYSSAANETTLTLGQPTPPPYCDPVTGVCDPPLLPVLANLEKNRFENGRLKLTDGANAPRFYRVVRNEGSQVTISGALGFPYVDQMGVTVWDDDDYNSNDGTNPDGDTDEDIAALNSTFSIMQYSDNVAQNVYAAAFVRPKYDSAGVASYNSSSVVFQNNVALVENDVVAQINAGRGAVNESDDFWVVYVQLDYQPDVRFDGDPDTELLNAIYGLTYQNPSTDVTDSVTGSASVPKGSNASLVFLESTKDVDRKYAYNYGARVVPHEVGHQFGLKGDVAGAWLMGYQGPSNPTEPLDIHPLHRNIIRWRIKSPGQ